MLNSILGGIFGLVVGDALGVPVEFTSREKLKHSPVVNMREYGTHNQPKGTWSDDTSLTLCLMDSLKDGLDYNDIISKFCSWLSQGYMTPNNVVFDVGISTRQAIENYKLGKSPLVCGLDKEIDNGNGSLMRILPVAFYTFGMNTKERFDIVHNISSLTHSHIRSKIACGIYIQFAFELLKGYSKEKAFDRAIKICKEYYKDETELKYFNVIIQNRIGKLDENEISSTGYVVDTLNAAIWCLLTTNRYSECVLKAVNLGDDTDTVAAVAGGLAGILYGYKSIPDEWIDSIIKHQEIEKVCLEFNKICKPFEKLYKYIPYFENNPYCKFTNQKNDLINFISPCIEYDKELLEFINVPEECDFLDYSYQDTIERYHYKLDDDLPNSINSANIELLLAILTAYIRGERFCDGLWIRCLKEKIFLKVLKRLKKLEEE